MLEIFKTMSVFEYVFLFVGIAEFIFGVAQLCLKRCVGIGGLDKYTDESIKKFSAVSTWVYIIAGIILAATPIALQCAGVSDNSLPGDTVMEIVSICDCAAILIPYFTILKKKNI